MGTLMEFRDRSVSAVKKVLPSTLKTALWIVEITVGVSFGIFILRELDVLPYISAALSPVFELIGLPGEAALAYVSGYFVNVYSAIAASCSLGLDTREMTILAVMVLCSHNMIVETAVQKKTGTSAVRIVLLRTVSGIILAYILNLLLPVTDCAGVMPQVAGKVAVENGGFWQALLGWLKEVGLLAPKIVGIIFVLNILQALLAEFGVIRWISKLMSPLMKVFGLSGKCSFLWIVANTLGLAYGSAVMIEESRTGKLGKEDIDRLNMHIGISHSNVEDLFLFASVGAVWWMLLLVRWAMSMLWVWGYRLERLLRRKKAEMAPGI